MNILIVKLNAIGDVLFATPLVEACRQVYPRARIDWLVATHAEPILRGHPSIRECIVYDGPYGGSGWASLYAYRQIMLRLRHAGYEVIFCLHRNFAAQLLVLQTQAPTRVGFRGGLSRFTLTHEVDFDPSDHETERYLDLLRALGRPVSNPGMKIGLTDDAEVTAELLWQDERIGSPAIALAPGGGRNPGTEMLIKRWPLERYQELARRLVGETGGTIVVVGSRDEAELCAAVAEAVPDRHVNLCGRTDLPQLAAVLARCRVMVANDSGPLHIAAALGVPTVALFGPTDPRLVAPLGARHRHLWIPPDCGPCYRPDNARSRSVWTCIRTGDELRCLRDVTVDMVLGGVLDALAGEPWPEHRPYPGRREPVAAK